MCGANDGRQALRSRYAFQESGSAAEICQLLVEGKISNDTFEEWNRESGAKKLPEHVARAPAKARKRKVSKRR